MHLALPLGELSKPQALTERAQPRDDWGSSNLHPVCKFKLHLFCVLRRFSAILRILLDRGLSACYHEHMNRCSYIETKGEDSMTGLEQTAPEKEKQPVEMPDDEVLYELADLFRVFGDSTRIKILYALHDSELCVQDIADAVQLSQSAVSHQLRVLKDSKLVRFRREGKTVFYALDDDHVRSILSMGMDHIEE